MNYYNEIDPLKARSVAAAGATRGFWGDCDWWYGRDGKYRPAGAGITPLIGSAKSCVLALADGGSGGMGLLRDSGDGELEEPQTGEARVGRLRLYGDGIVVKQATEFIKAYMGVRSEKP